MNVCRVAEAVSRDAGEQVARGQIPFAIENQAATPLFDVGDDQVRQKRALSAAGRPAEQGVTERSYDRLGEPTALHPGPGGAAEQTARGGDPLVRHQQRCVAEL